METTFREFRPLPSPFTIRPVPPGLVSIPPRTLSPDRTIHGAIERLRQRHANTLLVQGRKGDPEGLITQTVLLPECGTRAAAILGERIRSELGLARFRHQGRSFRATVSAGVCKRASAFRTPRDMMEETDRQLYRAKRGGRNRIKISP